MTKSPPEVGHLLDPAEACALTAGWTLARADAGSCTAPRDLAGHSLQWHEAQVPGTVAGCLHGDLDIPGDYDAHDWWYRTQFPRPAAGTRHYLRFEGLATIAEAWLNGQPILSSRNMFVPCRVDVTALMQEDNELAIVLRSLDRELARRRPRPRWKTRLVEKQGLRWFRTTLLGRMPAWTPAAPAVGPWGPVVLESVERADVSDLTLRARIEDGLGHVSVRARVEALEGRVLTAACLRVGEATFPLAVADGRIDGDIAIRDAPRWWPHTHGEPRLTRCRLELDLGGEPATIDCGAVGFRELALDTRDGAVRFVVNGVPVFCRGTAWTPLDILRLRAAPGELRRALSALREAGANMVRVGGTMAYESDEFYRLCDELGLMVWQDFMFANMDYPAADVGFGEEVDAEARHHVKRLAAHPCVVAWCGGSEVAQQAAMQGQRKEAFGGELFERVLPSLVAEHHPGTPYFPSSPWGGALPFHVGTGIAHYYGVGAYRRPLADARQARVKFATECLGFSNLPDGEPAHPPHHPRWKARVPRDNGAGYDFEDVRDHYLRELFGHDAVSLRASDLARYYAESRVVSGEVMARTYSEWRAPASGCGGALVWFNRDLWPGAGWGIVAADGTPKSPWWFLRRAWAPIAVRLADEGLDGASAHVINERAEPLAARLEVVLVLDGRDTGERAQSEVRIAAREAVTISVDAMFGHFTDATHAYRFGPPKAEVIVARLLGTDGAVLSEDALFPAGHDLPRVADACIETHAHRVDGGFEVSFRTDRFLQAVAIECDGWRPDDNYFHLLPGELKRLAFVPLQGRGRTFTAHLAPLNAAAFTVRFPGDADAS